MFHHFIGSISSGAGVFAQLDYVDQAFFECIIQRKILSRFLLSPTHLRTDTFNHSITETLLSGTRHTRMQTPRWIKSLQHIILKFRGKWALSRCLLSLGVCMCVCYPLNTLPFLSLLIWMVIIAVICSTHLWSSNLNNIIFPVLLCSCCCSF